MTRINDIEKEKFMNLDTLDLKKIVAEKKSNQRKNILNISKESKEEAKTTELQDISSKSTENTKIIFRRKDFFIPKIILDRMPLAVVSIILIFSLITTASVVKIYYWGSGVLGEVRAGQEKILSIKNALTEKDTEKIQKSILLAEDSFENARKQMDFLVLRLGNLARKESLFYFSEKFLESGNHLSQTAQKTFKVITKLKSSFKNIFAINQEKNGKKISEIIEENKADIFSSCEDMKLSTKYFHEGIKENLNLSKSLGVSFSELGSRLENLRQLACFLPENYEGFMKILGQGTTSKFLIIFQNSAELRPTGGFIGSFATVDVLNSQVKNISFKDVYDLDGSFESDIPAPPGISRLTPTLEMRDSNIHADFSKSAKLISQIYEKAGGESLDFVIGINEKFLQAFIEEIPNLSIKMPNGKSVSLDRDNALRQISFLVESKRFGQKTPKKIIEKLLFKFLEAVENEEFLLKIFPKIKKLKEENHIFAFGFNEDSQELFRKLKVSGEFKTLEPNEDFLHISHTNIGGNKTDPYIEEKIFKETKVLSDAQVLVNLKISREHNFGEAEQENLKNTLAKIGVTEISENLKNIMGRGTNRSFIKIYVPRGSELKNIIGIDEGTLIKGEEEKRSFFAFEVSTNSQNKTSIELEYVLPFTLIFDPVSNFKTTFIKSPGMQKQGFFEKIFVSENFEILRNSPNAVRVYKNFASFGDIFSEDTVNAVLVSKVLK